MVADAVLMLVQKSLDEIDVERAVFRSPDDRRGGVCGVHASVQGRFQNGRGAGAAQPFPNRPEGYGSCKHDWGFLCWLRGGTPDVYHRYSLHGDQTGASAMLPNRPWARRRYSMESGAIPSSRVPTEISYKKRVGSDLLK
jgi:hypothetical protein